MLSRESARSARLGTFGTDLTFATGLFLFAFALRLLAIAITDFDGLYGQDPFAYYDYSLALRRALAAGDGPPPFFWPIGYPLLVALATAILGESPRSAQLVSVIAGSCAAPLVYACVRMLRPDQRAGALVAGLLAAIAAQLMISSLSVMTDATGLAWITLSAWALLRHQHALTDGTLSRPAFAWLALAALTFALAVLARWAYLLPAVPFALSALLAWHITRCPWKRRVAAAAAAGAILLVVVGLPLLPELGSDELAHVGDLQVVGWNPLNAFRSTVANSDGTFHYDRPIGLFYALPLVHPRFLFPLLSPFVVLGAVRLFREQRAACVLFVGWPLMVYVFLAGIAWENPRFALTYFPPLLVLAGVGLGRVFGPGVSHRGAITWVVLALLGSLAWCVRDVQRFTAMKHDHLEAVRWAERATPEEATIIAFGLTQTLQHYTKRNVANLYHLDSESLAVLTAGAAPTYLLLDPANVETQWQGLSPGQNLDWLRTRQELTPVDRHPPWEIFRIEPRRLP